MIFCEPLIFKKDIKKTEHVLEGMILPNDNLTNVKPGDILAFVNMKDVLDEQYRLTVNSIEPFTVVCEQFQFTSGERVLTYKKVGSGTPFEATLTTPDDFVRVMKREIAKMRATA